MSYRPSAAEKVFGGDLWRLRSFLRALTSIVIGLMPVRAWRHAARERIDQWLIKVNADKVAYFLERYPKVRSEAETLQLIADNKLSIARFGDGEFNMCIGRDKKSYQVYNQKLVDRLVEILHSDHPNVLIGINTVSKDNITDIWKKFVIRRGNRVLNVLPQDRVYESSTITTNFPDNPRELDQHVALLKRIWEDRKILFVVGKNSRFYYLDELFDNCREHAYVYAPAKNAFDEYESILDKVKTYDKDWLVMIALGPAATVLAYDLALDGYQAIDLGQTPSRYHRARYGTLYPQGHPLYHTDKNVH